MHNHTLYVILSRYVRNELSLVDVVDGFSDKEWQDLYKASAMQGVLAVVYGMVSVLPKEVTLPRNIKLQWAIGVENIAYRAQKQIQIANELADIFKANEIKTVVLKGLGLGVYYPSPMQRECGDFDCFLFNDFQKGIEVAKEYGAKVGHIDYKHAQLIYKGVSIEVHRYFTSFRGEKNKHEFESVLNSLIRKSPCNPVYEGSSILVASPTFNAVFLVYHTLFHFLFESVKLRHILDWGLMVRAEQENIDWEVFRGICAKHKMLKFAETITAICNDYLGFDLALPINAKSEYRDKVLLDMMSNTDSVSNKRGWRRRLQLLKNTYNARWKYQLVDTTYILDLAKRGFYFIFSNDKHNTL